MDSEHHSSMMLSSGARSDEALGATPEPLKPRLPQRKWNSLNFLLYRDRLSADVTSHRTSSKYLQLAEVEASNQSMPPVREMDSEHDSAMMLSNGARSDENLEATPEAPKLAWLLSAWLQRKVDSLLYGDTESADATTYQKSNRLVAIVFFCIMVGVNVYLSYIIYKSWPTVDIMYYTNKFNDSSRGGKVYTGGCIDSLPPSMQTPENLPNLTTLKQCYRPSDLVNVTVVMFSNSSRLLVEEIFNLSSPTQLNQGSTTQQISEVLVEGLYVSQEAHELTVQNISVYDHLGPLYVGGVRQDDIYAPTDYVLSGKFNDYPSSYMQMSWVYDCNNCSSCSLRTVIDWSRRAVDETWVSCYYYEYPDTCDATNNYTGKCVLYPPVALPATIAVKNFLTTFLDLPGINNVRNDEYPGGLQNTTLLRPNVLYLNVSQFAKSTMQLGLFEVKKGSAMWVLLVEKFPTLGTECSTLPAVQVCNGTSLCNLFKGASIYDLNCEDFTNSYECEKYKNNHYFSTDNEGGRNKPWDAWDDIICPPLITCAETFPSYLVTRNTVESMQNDSLNSFLTSNILDSEWAQRSGVCTTTYKNVVRYQPGTGVDSQLQETMALETKCINGSANQASFCWLTGYYHNLSDLPNTQWKSLPDNLFQNSSLVFAFYRVEKEKFRTWFINGFGVQAGWIGSISFVFFGIFTWIFAPFRRFIHSLSSRGSDSSHKETDA